MSRSTQALLHVALKTCRIPRFYRACSTVALISTYAPGTVAWSLTQHVRNCTSAFRCRFWCKKLQLVEGVTKAKLRALGFTESKPLSLRKLIKIKNGGLEQIHGHLLRCQLA
jgi:hypothetical protein